MAVPAPEFHISFHFQMSDPTCAGINEVSFKKSWQPNCNKYKRAGALERGRSWRKTLNLPAPTRQQRLWLARLAAGREKLSKEGAHAQSKEGFSYSSFPCLGVE